MGCNVNECLFYVILKGRLGRRDGVFLEWNTIDRFAKSLIKEAGHKIRNSFFEHIQIEAKSNVNDLVTNIDKEIEQFFIKNIQFSYSDHRVLGEEGFGDQVTALNGIVWIIDPIDGTTNFIHQKRNFAISIGVYEDGVGVLGYIYDVVRDELYAAQKGMGAFLNDERLPKLSGGIINDAIIGLNARWINSKRDFNGEKLLELVADCRGMRSYGSAALELAYVASGKLDAYISGRLSPWDIAGGVVIAKEVGAVVTNLKGQAPGFIGPDSLIVSRPDLHETILRNYFEARH